MPIIRSTFRFVVLLINLIVAGILLLMAAGQILTPTVVALPSMLGIAFEWLCVLNIFFVLFWLFTSKKSWSILSLVALLCSLGGINSTISLRATECPAGKEISILSYNTHCLGFENHSARTNRVLNYIREQDADVVCLQEFVTYKNNLRFNLLAVKLFLDYPYSYIDFKTYKGIRRYGLAVFSKYPLINKQTLQYESNTNISNRCDMIVGDDTIRLFNNHLQSNRLDAKDLSLNIEHQEAFSEHMQAKAEQIGLKLSDALRLRAVQADAVQEEINLSPYPVIVCGDFNDVPVSYTYHTISKGLKDAFIQSTAWQLGHTFDKKGLGVRIDYILHDKRLFSRDFQIDKTTLSDHYPIRCTLILPH